MYDKVFKDFKLVSKVSPELIAKYEGRLKKVRDWYDLQGIYAVGGRK